MGAAQAARERMQRIRVGVTGLAAVVLLLALATALATGVRRNAATEPRPPLADNAANVQATPSNVIDPNAEPLAQLGVAPGATDSQGDKPKN